jgi:hypothetical protein
MEIDQMFTNFLSRNLLCVEDNMQDLFNADSVLVKIMYRNRSLTCIYLLIYGSFWLHYKIKYLEESQHHLSFS